MRWPDMPVRPIAALLLCSSCALARAAEAPEYSAEVSIGGEYDSNVTVDEVDISSSQSDYALTTDAELRASQQFNDTTGGSLTYDFSQTNYQEFTIVDRQTHLLGRMSTASSAVSGPGCPCTIFIRAWKTTPS